MVTKEDYLKALEIVNEYHIHILQKAIQVDYLSKPKTRDLFSLNKNIFIQIKHTLIRSTFARKWVKFAPLIYLCLRAHRGVF